MAQAEESGVTVDAADEDRPGWLARLIRRIEGKTTLVRSILFNVLVMVAILVLIPVIISELASDRVTITSISVPAALEEKGLNGAVVANRLWDAWSQVTDELKIAKETRDILPSSQRIEFSIPDSGISFESLIHHVRAFFGRAELRISGELVCVADPCSLATSALRLRVIDKSIEVIDLPPPGEGDVNAWFRKAISEALLVIDPVRGILALRSESEERAIAELRRLARNGHADSIWALTFAAQLMINGEDYAAARRLADEALAIDASFADALVTRAAAELGDGAIDAARATIGKALAYAPRNAQALKWRAEIAARAGDTEAAVADLVRAAALEPDNAEYLFRLGVLHNQTGDAAAAAAAFRQALEIDAESVSAMKGLSLLAMLAGDMDELVRRQSAIVKVTPHDADAHAQLASAYAMSDRHAEALASYAKAIELAPKAATHRIGLGRVALAAGDGRQALAAFAEARQLAPDNSRIWYDIGRAETLVGNPDGARAAFEVYIAAHPDTPEAALARAMLEKEN
jgi:tetratricopeptide (TPR) repeat protein